MSVRLRDPRTSVRSRLALSFALFLLASPLLAPPALANYRVLESDSRRVLLEITPGEPSREILAGEDAEYVRLRIEGLGATEEPGRPEVPVGAVRVALPPGTTPRLRVVGERWSAMRAGAVTPVPERVAVREAFRADQVLEREPVAGPEYVSAGSYPARRFVLSPVRGLRNLRVVSLEYYPVIAEVPSRGYRVLEKATVEIVFESDLGRARTPVGRPAPADELWERTYRGTVANAGRALAWARGGPGDGTLVGDTPWGGDDQWRVRIESTGLFELGYDELAARGFPSGVPIEQVSIYQRSFDLEQVDAGGTAAPDLFVALPVPAYERDRNADGTFNSGDGLQFYARSFRDQWMTSGYEHEDKYETLNFVWVRIEATGGARMTETRTGGSLSGAPADSLDSTPSKVFREENFRYYDHPPDHAAGRQHFESEIYYFNDSRTPTGGASGWFYDDPFTATDPVPSRPASVLVRVVPGGGGRTGANRNNTNIVEYSVNGNLVGERTFYNNDFFVGDVSAPHHSLTTHSIDAGLVDGENTFRLHGWSYRGRGTSNVDFFTRFFFDWYEVLYDRELFARSGRLELSTENGAGNVLARVRGFGGDDLLLFDVTDPAAPAAVGVDPAQIVDGGGGLFDLRFDHDNAGGAASYVAIRDDSVPEVAAEAITRRSQSTLLAGGVGARYVVVAYDEFLPGAEELADYRAQTMSALSVSLSEVYDVFNNGARHPDAIKKYATYAFHRWSDPIAFLCLIGDASEDHQAVTNNPAPDFLPSHSLWAEYEGAPEDTDQYFGEVTRPSPGEDFDDLVDIYVGRIAVNTLEEALWNVERIRDYENNDLDADWRRRVLLLADDNFSGSLGGGLGQPYGWQRSEAQFEIASREIADSLQAHPHDLIIPELLMMSDWSHPLPDSCYGNYCRECERDFGEDGGTWYECRIPQDNCLLGTGNWGDEYVCMRESMWQQVLPVLRDRLNDGVLIWNFQGHANRFFLTHEEVFKDFSSRNDVESSLDNPGRPFIFLGFACHLAEFDKFDEGSELVRDCVSEKMMNLKPFLMDRPGGAVAVFASSGFEFLSPNLIFNKQVMDAFFYPDKVDDVGNELPDVPGTGGVYRWTLGETTTRARLLFQRTFPGGNTRQAAQRFVLLGDPALQPRLGTPQLDVMVEGVQVEDPGSVFFMEQKDFEAPITVMVTAVDGRGVGDVRVLDAGQAVDPVLYLVEQGQPSEHGVVREKRITYTFLLREAERYDVNFETRDAAGRWSGFTIRVNSGQLSLADGQEPVIYPNPFDNQMNLSYKLSAGADEVRVRVYTVAGRKIWEGDGPGVGNVTHAVRWNGRDDNGNPVANGTYIVRFKASSAAGSIERTLAAVKMR